MKNILSPAVKAVIIRDDKFLIIKQEFPDKTVWDFPGGKIEYKESPYAALIREVKEEVDIEIKTKKPLGFFWFFRYDEVQVICTTFLCTAERHEIDIDKCSDHDYITDYQWVTKEGFLTDRYKVSHESQKDLVKLI